MRLLLSVMALVLLTACGNSTAPTTPVNATLSIGLGQSVVVEGTSITVRFDSVLEDSRCPMNAMCVTAGQAAVQVSVSNGSGSSVQLRSDPASARVASVGDVRLQWLQLEPYPVAGQAPAGETRLTIRVNR